MYRTDFIREKKTDVNDVNESVEVGVSFFSLCTYQYQLCVVCLCPAPMNESCRARSYTQCTRFVYLKNSNNIYESYE